MSRVTRAIIRKSNFTQNQDSSLQASDSAVTIIESNFYNNGRYFYDALSSSVIYASNSEILIKKSWFNNNTAYSNGGAIYASYSNLTIGGSEFSYNSVVYREGGGGAISVDQHSGHRIQINSTIFYGMSWEWWSNICVCLLWEFAHSNEQYDYQFQQSLSSRWCCKLISIFL